MLHFDILRHLHSHSILSQNIPNLYSVVKILHLFQGPRYSVRTLYLTKCVKLKTDARQPLAENVEELPTRTEYGSRWLGIRSAWHRVPRFAPAPKCDAILSACSIHMRSKYLERKKVLCAYPILRTFSSNFLPIYVNIKALIWQIHKKSSPLNPNFGRVQAVSMVCCGPL
jgi:hypothetical protein